MTKKNIIIFIIIILLFFISGWAIFWVTGGQRLMCPSSVIDNNDTFQAGWEAAKKRLAETGAMFQVPTPKESVQTVRGAIKDIQGNKIAVKIIPIEPLSDPDLDNRIIEISSQTEIWQIVKKDEQQYQQEVEEFYKNMQDYLDRPDAPPGSPSPYIQKEATVTELQLGQQVVVGAFEDVENKKQFPAREITIQY